MKAPEAIDFTQISPFSSYITVFLYPYILLSSYVHVLTVSFSFCSGLRTISSCLDTRNITQFSFSKKGDITG